MVIIRKTINNKCCQGWEERNPCTRLVGMQNAAATIAEQYGGPSEN